jgi:hypothetical protein
MEPQKHNPFYARPVGLAITVEEIYHVLANIQLQRWNLRRHRMKMRLLRLQLAVMETNWRGSLTPEYSL